MATKARHLKTPIQLWVVDERKRLGLKPRDIARWTGVTEATARGWESQGRPGADAIAILEEHFGSKAPGQKEGEVPTDLASAMRDLADAIRGQTLLLAALAEVQAQQSVQVESNSVRIEALAAVLGRLIERDGRASPTPEPQRRTKG